MVFIERELAPEPALQAVIGIGSIASGLARPDSDIDAILFLDPLDLYIVPAEFKWRPSDSSFHSIFSQVSGLEEALQFDFARFDLARWADPSFEWPEQRCAELHDGWLAFDRSGQVAELIETRTAYADATRITKLDEAITMLDQHLSDDRPQSRWDSLGPVIAQDRLQAAYEYLVQALFAYNRRWRPWRSREMSSSQEADPSIDNPPAIPLDEHFPSLTYNPSRYTSDTRNQVIYIDGDMAKEIFLLFEGTESWKVFSQNGKEYIVYIRVIFPHEKVRDPSQ